MTRTAAFMALCMLLAAAMVAGYAEPAAGEYHVIKKYSIGGDGGWDYLTMDSEARRLYISRATRVMVLDIDSGKVTGEIPNTPGVHGIALVPKRKQGYISNGGDNTVTIFDLETLKETARVKVGTRPDAIVYDPASDRVFTFNAGSKDATAIATETGTVAGTVALGGKPESAAGDGKGHMYVNIEDKNEIVVFDTQKLNALNRYPTAPGVEPVGLAMDTAKRRLFCTCHSEKMVILDAESGKVVATPAIGKGTDACIFDEAKHLAFSSNGDGTLTVVEEQSGDQYRVLASVPTQLGARTMALDTKTHNIILCTANFKPAAPGQRRQVEPNTFVVLIVGK